MQIDGRKIRVAFMMGNAVMAKALMIAAAWYVGSKLDDRYGTEPYIMFSMVIISMILGVCYILRVAKKLNLTD